MSNIHKKHARHNALARNRHSAFSDFLAAQATAKTAPERVIRDLFRSIPAGVTGKTAVQIEAAATAALAGATVNTISLTAAQRELATPGTTSFGASLPAVQTRSLLLGATSGALTVDFDATANTITRGSGSFVDDGFQIGSILNLSGCADAGNNSSHPVVTTVTALVLTCDDIAADEAADAGVTITTLNTITDANGIAIDFAVEAADELVITGTVANNGTYTVASVSGPVILLTDLLVSPAVDTSVGIRVASGDINFGRAYACAEVVDELCTIDRYAGTLSLAEGDFEDEGFVAGTKVKIRTLHNGEVDTVVRTVAAGVLTVAKATTGSITVTFALGAKGTATRATGSFLTDGFVPGMEVAISAGAADAGNRSIFTVLSVTALVMTLKDLPASETNDAGVTITSVDFRKDEEYAGTKFVQYNTLEGLPTTSLIPGSVLIGTDPNGKAFQVTVASINSDVLFVTGAEFDGSVDDGGAYSLFHANFLVCATGDFVADGFTVGERVDISSAGAGNSGSYTLLDVSGGASGYVYTVEPFETETPFDSHGNVSGRSILTRGAGSWATDHFDLGRMFYLSGTTDGLNDAFYRVAKVVSTTVIEVDPEIPVTGEIATAAVKAWLITEKAR